MTGERDFLEAALDLAEQKNSEWRKHHQFAPGKTTISDTRGFGRGFYVIAHLLEAVPDNAFVRDLAQLGRDVLWQCPSLDERGFAPSPLEQRRRGFRRDRDLRLVGFTGLVTSAVHRQPVRRGEGDESPAPERTFWEKATILHAENHRPLAESGQFAATWKQLSRHAYDITISGFVEIEIFNNGKPPNPEDMDNLFVPFYSSKSHGTGFGLPIAQLAAKKNMGELYLERMPDQGAKCVIQLPVPANKKR